MNADLRTTNRWYQMDDAYWMCVGWDVWLQHGEWHVAPYHAKRPWAAHGSAHDAMNWADNYRGIDRCR